MLMEICPPNSTQHVVEEGDTFWKLSQSYGVSVQNIVDANPGINANNLQIGSILCIPANPASPNSLHTCPDRTFSYIVHSGDTLWKLSQAYGISTQSIIDVNPGIDPQNLQIGSTLCIPAAQTVQAPSGKTTPTNEIAPLTPAAPMTSEIPPVTCPNGTFGYTIQSGDTLWKLSLAYGISPQSILAVNPGINPQNLQIGSTLCIPTVQTLLAPSEKTTAPTKKAPLTPATPMTPKIPPLTCPKGAFSYTVQSGDTLWKLSQSFGMNIQSILDVNPGINPQNLQIGSTLCIPAVTTPPEKSASPAKMAPLTPATPMTPEIPPVTCPKGTFSYTIQSGDTLWKLSQSFGVNIQSILDINPGINPQNLQIGSTLCIPAVITPPEKSTPPAKMAPLTPATPMTSEISPVPCPKGTFSYTIQSGDTLWKLSQSFGVNIQSILDVNPGINPQNLQIGSTLCIPAVTTPPEKSASPAKMAPLTPATPMTPETPQAIPTPSHHFAYCIKRCDTIWGIAQNFYVSVESILNENPGINPRCLQAGTYIYVPVNCCGKNTWRYTIMAGDTLDRIANKLAVCPSALISANPNIDFQHLIHCQVICIPKE